MEDTAGLRGFAAKRLRSDVLHRAQADQVAAGAAQVSYCFFFFLPLFLKLNFVAVQREF